MATTNHVRPGEVQQARTEAAAASAGQAGWTSATIAANAVLYGISCPSTTTCFAVGSLAGNDSLIERTTDAGSSWSSVAFASTSSIGGLDDISCFDTTHCIAVGGGGSNHGTGTAFATSDGTDWTQLSLPSGTSELGSIDCISNLDCYSTSFAGKGLTTTNGGAKWTPLGYNLTSPQSTTVENFGIDFTSTTIGFVVGEAPSQCTTSGCAGYIQQTANGGTSWAFDSIPSASALTAIACPSSQECVAVGGTYTQATGERTTNGGTSWSALSLPSGVSYANSVSCPTTSDCFAVGEANDHYSSPGVVASSNAVVLNSTDGGATWTEQQVEGGLYSLLDVSCPSSDQCLSVGSDSAGAAVASTTDAGAPPSPGYWMVASDGGVFTFGSAKFFGSTGGVKLVKPVVGMAADPVTGGYWLVASDGGIFSFNAPFHGSTGGVDLKEPIVGMAVDPVTGGYWLVASDGGIFSFDAPFYGSEGGTQISAPIVGMAVLADGDGYFLVGQDGSVYAFGAAAYSKCTGTPDFGEPTIGMAADTDTGGYWFVSDLGEFATCDSPFYGDTATVHLAQPIVGVTGDQATGGYWFAASDGGVFSFDAPFLGSTGGVKLVKPVVGIASVPGG